MYIHIYLHICIYCCHYINIYINGNTTPIDKNISVLYISNLKKLPQFVIGSHRDSQFLKILKKVVETLCITRRKLHRNSICFFFQKVMKLLNNPRTNFYQEYIEIRNLRKLNKKIFFYIFLNTSIIKTFLYNCVLKINFIEYEFVLKKLF